MTEPKEVALALSTDMSDEDKAREIIKASMVMALNIAKDVDVDPCTILQGFIFASAANGGLIGHADCMKIACLKAMDMAEQAKEHAAMVHPDHTTKQ